MGWVVYNGHEVIVFGRMRQHGSSELGHTETSLTKEVSLTEGVKSLRKICIGTGTVRTRLSASNTGVEILHDRLLGSHRYITGRCLLDPEQVRTGKDLGERFVVGNPALSVRYAIIHLPWEPYHKGTFNLPLLVLRTGGDCHSQGEVRGVDHLKTWLNVDGDVNRCGKVLCVKSRSEYRSQYYKPRLSTDT